jgi:hypothetical protein
MSHTFYDICITGAHLDVDHDLVKLHVDQSRDDENEKLTSLFLTKKDIAEIGKHLDLIVIDKSSII